MKSFTKIQRDKVLTDQKKIYPQKEQKKRIQMQLGIE